MNIQVNSPAEGPITIGFKVWFEDATFELIGVPDGIGMDNVNQKIEKVIMNYNKTFEKRDIDPDIKTEEMKNILKYIHDLVKFEVESKLIANKFPI